MDRVQHRIREGNHKGLTQSVRLYFFVNGSTPYHETHDTKEYKPSTTGRVARRTIVPINCICQGSCTETAPDAPSLIQDAAKASRLKIDIIPFSLVVPSGFGPAGDFPFQTVKSVLAHTEKNLKKQRESERLPLHGLNRHDKSSWGCINQPTTCRLSSSRTVG